MEVGLTRGLSSHLSFHVWPWGTATPGDKGQNSPAPHRCRPPRLCQGFIPDPTPDPLLMDPDRCRPRRGPSYLSLVIIMPDRLIYNLPFVFFFLFFFCRGMGNSWNLLETRTVQLQQSQVMKHCSASRILLKPHRANLGGWGGGGGKATSMKLPNLSENESWKILEHHWELWLHTNSSTQVRCSAGHIQDVATGLPGNLPKLSLIIILFSHKRKETGE